MTAISNAFLKLHIKGQPLVMPNPWDLGSTRILEQMGFRALATTSAGFAFTLGRRDAEGGITRDEAIAHARQIAEATDLPVNGDTENGFGPTPDDCAETARQSVAAGLAGFSIEDATGDHSDPIFEFDLSVERVRAAVEAGRDAGGIVMTARAENFLYGKRDLDDTIRRLNAFADAGADVLYAPGLRDIETVRTVIRSVDRPVNILASPGLTAPELADAGAARISLGSAFAINAWRGLVNAAEEVLDQGSFGFAAGKPGFMDINKMMKGR
ncbi:isocitrate lyase/PEP mutase family protein [Minwuia sp.]|uniref:isocitrate lyase/PEP mutase family protein n=1 Tax=Minwuia sp. TaxID=2493630 RepID=UPI003A92976F